MSCRYFVAEPISGSHAVLTEQEAHHLLHVMRLGEGDEVLLFDGSGAEFPARVEKTTRREVHLAVLARRAVDRELPLQVVLAVALPKGDRQKWLVEKAVELGVGRLIPLRCERSVAQPGKQTLRRLERTVIEASKQCGRNRLMQIADPVDWAALAAEPPDNCMRYLAHPGAPSGTELSLPAEKKSAQVAIGPEGGLSDEEIAIGIEHDWHLLSLGKRILRIETAAVAVAAHLSLLAESRRKV